MEFPFTKAVVERLLEERCYDDVLRLRDDYVGRGQQKPSVGFVAPEVRNVVQFLIELAGETDSEGVELEDLAAIAGTMCSDSFGKDCIVYFPNTHFVAEPGAPIDPAKLHESMTVEV